MNKIEVFICASAKDITVAEEIRKILTKCYGFNAFLFKHNIVGSNDFYKEIIARLQSCEIFIPLISKHIIGSSFSNQEIGFVINRAIKQEVIIFPISIDEIKPYGLIDHVQAHPCNPEGDYGILKSTTSFFQIVLCHKDFMMYRERAIDGMIQALKDAKTWEVLSAIIFMFKLTRTQIKFDQNQLNEIINITKNSNYVYKFDKLHNSLRNFLQESYEISID